MVTMAQRLEQLRQEKGLSRPALSAALGLPRTAIEKFETGRQTPTQAQQEKIAAYFGVSVFYLRGESPDTTQMSDWMDGAFQQSEQPAPAAVQQPRRAAAQAARTAREESPVFAAFLDSPKFKQYLQEAIREALASPEGRALVEKAVRKELDQRR